MDEYLRSRYKKVDSDEPAEPPKPAGGRYAPPAPERLYAQPARPMFPANPRPHSTQPPAQPARPMFPVNPPSPPPPRPAPVQHQPQPNLAPQPALRPAPAPPRPSAAAEQNIPAARQAAVQARPKRRFRFVKILAVLLIIAGLAGGGGYYYIKYVKPPTPLPQNLVKSASFPIYYPVKQTGAYKYQTGSASSQKGLFIYKINDGSNGVVVSQQAKPSTNVDLSALPKFTVVPVSTGSAVIGTSSGDMTIIYLTPTTLLNITAVNDISRADMISIAQSLSPVKVQAKLL